MTAKSKRLFKDDGYETYTEAGMELSSEAARLVTALVEREVARGTSLRDVEYVLVHAVQEICLWTILEQRAKLAKASRGE